MNLTAQGEEAIAMDALAKKSLAAKLIRGDVDVNQYTNGVCYDAAAFVKYLLGGGVDRDGTGITDQKLRAAGGPQWVAALQSDKKWAYGQSIEAGSVLTFRRLTTGEVFHAAVAIGQTRLRGVNGLRLGAGWSIPADLSTVLVKCPDNPHDKVYKYDGTSIVVQIQAPAGKVPAN